jgi:hypothetical protein
MAEFSSQQDVDVSLEGPAIYANRVIVNVRPVVRLSFIEQTAADKPPTFRAAVAIPHQTAFELAAILKTVLKDIEVQFKAAQQAQEKAASATAQSKSNG